MSNIESEDKGESERERESDSKRESPASKPPEQYHHPFRAGGVILIASPGLIQLHARCLNWVIIIACTPICHR